MQIEVYNSDHHLSSFRFLLVDYFNEVEGGCKVSVDSKEIFESIEMMEKSRHIYIVFNDNREQIGFLVMYINDQFGLAEPVAVTEYVYLKEEYRSGLAIKHLCLTVMNYCVTLNMDLVGVVYNDSSNIGNYKYLGGLPIATIVRTDVAKLGERLDRYQRINKKG